MTVGSVCRGLFIKKVLGRQVLSRMHQNHQSREVQQSAAVGSRTGAVAGDVWGSKPKCVLSCLERDLCLHPLADR